MSRGCNNETVIVSNQNSNTINIDLLFLDLSVCSRCQGTEETLEDSINSVSSLLEETGYDISINKIHIETPEQAIQHQFVSSPTIRINGQDIQMDVSESHCSTCSSLTDGASVDCREWSYKGKSYHVPPKGLIIDGVMKNIYSNIPPHNASADYVLPDNLVEYFEKKDQLCEAVNKEQVSDVEGCGCAVERNVGTGCC